MSNETWHIEPTRKYGKDLVDIGPSIIYNALDVDMTKYNRNNPFRSKRFVVDEENEESSSFCGLNKNDKRKKMQEETERLAKGNDEYTDSRSRYARSKRQTTNNNDRERTCCYIYIRVDPTLWDVVYKNEGLNVRRFIQIIFISNLFIYLIGKRTNYSCNCYISLSNSNSSKCYLSSIKI